MIPFLVKFNRREIKRRFKQHRHLVGVAELLFDCHLYKDALLLAERVSTNAMYNYAGFYTDGALENLITKIATQCLLQPSIGEYPNIKRIVHIVSSVSRIGGHGRFLQKWIERDTLSLHRVVVTQQIDAETEFFGADELIELERGAGLLEKAAALQSLLTDAYLIVLHHSSNDLVPLLALGNKFIKAPVAVLNHADHLPWVGSSVCDYLIEIREGFLSIDKKRRQILKGGYLPIPVSPVQANINRVQSREQLGISNDIVVLLTITSAYKFAPIGDYHFFEDIIPVLDQYRQAILYIIGMPSEHELAVHHPQIVYVGILIDTEVYKQAADLYIESFPFASFTSLLETAINGIPIQLMYDPPMISKMETVTAEEQLIWNYPTSKSEWIDSISKFISDNVYRQERALLVSQVVRKNHFQNWNNYLEKIYSDLQNEKHITRKLVDTPFAYSTNEYYLSCLQANLFKLKSSYQMVPLPIQLRLRIVKKWLLKNKADSAGSIPFLVKFLLGKA